MKPHAVLLIAVATGCASPHDDESALQQSVISDQAHAGRRGFFFLPPMVPEPHAGGVFDSGLAPTVEIRELDSGRIVATFEAEVRDRLYVANWNTRALQLDPARTYRISVWDADEQLGFADVDVVSNGRELKRVSTDEFIPLLDGRTLPIQFRIEAGVHCMGNHDGCVVQVPVGGSVQAAIDRVGDRGAVVLGAGTFTEMVAIEGKRVELLGDPAGGTRFELAPSTARDLASATGIVEYRRGGGGRIENLTFVGGDAAVRGRRSTGPLSDLSITNVQMARNGYGVTGTWPHVTLSKVTITDSLHLGYQGCGETQIVHDSLIENSNEMGLFFANCYGSPTGVVAVDGTTVVGAQGGGAVFLGNLDASITGSHFSLNRGVGVALFSVTKALMIDSIVDSTQLGPIGNFEGIAMGLLADSTPSVFLLNSLFLANPLTGIGLVSSSCTAHGVESSGGKYGRIEQQGSSLTDLGGNTFIGSVQDVLSDGALPLPGPPAVPEY